MHNVTVHGQALLEPKVPYDNVVAAGICRIEMFNVLLTLNLRKAELEQNI